MVRVSEQMHGGGHETGRRSGTLNTPGIAGLGEAARLARESFAAEATRLAALRDRLLAALQRDIEGLVVNGTMKHRLPNNLNISIPGVEGETLLMSLRDVALSSGSACSTASAEPSHVLAALGVSPELSHASLRFGLGRWTTEEEIDFAAQRLAETVKRLRSLGFNDA